MRSAWVRIFRRKRAAMLRLLHRPVLEGLDEAPDRGERGAQLVGGVRDEILPDLLQLVPAGDVVEREDRAVRRSGLAGEGHRGQGVGLGHPSELHLDQASLSRPKHLLDHRADLLLVNDLGVVPPERVPKLEPAAQRLVGHQNDPPVLHREDAVLHRGEDRLDPGLVPRVLVEPLLQQVGGGVEDAGEVPDLVRALDVAARGEVSGRETVGGVHDGLHRAHDRRDQGHGQRGGDPEGHEQREGHRPQQLPRLLFERGEVVGDTREAEEPPVLLDRHRPVEEVAVDGGAPPQRRADALLAGLDDLGPVGVVLDGGERFARELGVREDATVGGDDGHPGADVSGGVVDEPVELVRRDPGGQERPDEPRHETRLGEQ